VGGLAPLPRRGAPGPADDPAPARRPGRHHAADRRLRRTVGLPAGAVTAWRTSATQRISGDRQYSPHVFTPADIGPVHLQFQVSHHVYERAFVVAALFSWPSHTA